MIFSFKRLLQSTLYRQLQKFLIVGTTTVLVDYVIYITLTYFLFLQFGFSKAISFICGSIFSYTTNRIWTFENSEYNIRNLLYFGGLYFVTLIINVLVNDFFLFLFSEHSMRVSLSFFFATSVSAAINFLGMKYFVFQK